MNGWPESTMREAMDVLVKSCRNDLASDLDRIFAAINFEDLEIMRSDFANQLADEILNTESLEQLTDCLRKLTQAMRVQHCTVHIVRENAPQAYTTKVVTTYPHGWIATYVNRRYINVDPVIRASCASSQSFYWDTLRSDSPLINAFWRDAKACGIGSSGYTIPVATENNDVLALSVCSEEPAQAFRERMQFHESDLYNLGIYLADAFCKLASNQRPTSFNPTDDQLLVLCAISMGVDEAELAQRTYLYGSFTTLKRSICALFQTRTLSQAAVLAARIGLLDSVPLTRGDVLTAEDMSAEISLGTSNGQVLRRLVRGRSAHSGPTEDAA